MVRDGKTSLRRLMIDDQSNKVYQEALDRNLQGNNLENDLEKSQSTGDHFMLSVSPNQGVNAFAL